MEIVEQTKKKTARRGIQSIEIGFKILDIISRYKNPIPLKKIAEEAELSVANVHYYLVSFMKVGMIQQAPDTGCYGLGSYALHLSLAAMEQFDIYTSARPVMTELASETGHTIFLGVWGNKGATIVYKVEGRNDSDALLELKIGSVLPLLNSALGRNFLAHLPESYIEGFLDNELKSSKNSTQPRHTKQEVIALQKEIRMNGISRCRHDLIRDYTSLSAPIYNMLGEIIAALTIMAPITSLDDDLNGDIAKLIKQSAMKISRLAGYKAKIDEDL